MKKENLKKYLEKNYLEYKKFNSSIDPVWNLHSHSDKSHQELNAFILSCFSYGKVEIMNAFYSKLLSQLPVSLYEFASGFNEINDKKYLRNLKYRFNVTDDLIFLFKKLKQVLIKYKTLENLFLSGYSDSDTNILNGLYNFTDFMKAGIKKYSSYHYLIPDSRKNSTCKRLNLFLRWMVRKDEIDLGLWSKHIPKSKLIIPVDVHVYRISQELNLISRISCDMKYAVELTEYLKQFDADDPVKYDFALCHIGIDKNKKPSSLNDEG